MKVKWIKSRFKYGISNRTFADDEIVADDINCLVTQAKWVGSEISHDAYACILYSFK